MASAGRLRVAVIGAGAAGLCAARHLLARADTFAPPAVFELTERVGGTWVYEDRVGSYNDGRPVLGSMYRDLRTNLPKEVMMFPDFPFDPELPSFLPHEEVLSYLERYCINYCINPHIRFRTQVVEVKPIASITEGWGGVIWELTSCDAERGRHTETFDSVFVCNGHYSEPFIPPVPGLENFKGTVLHSHSYRSPEPYTGQSVVILGAGASGVDIAMELSTVNAQVTLSHGQTPLCCPLPAGVSQVPPVERVLEDGALQFQGGEQVRPEVFMLCTGYRFTFPFLGEPELGLRVQDHLISPLYKYLLPPAFPSLFFIGMCRVICPFPHFHCQVQFALAVLEGTVTLLSRAQMEEEVAQERDGQLAAGVAERHLFRLSSAQWDYARELAQKGGFPALPPVTQSLYEEVGQQRRQDPRRYRERQYRLVSDTQWELVE
ncbi:GSXL3 monooxygenase, partial [Amia calva]|nr:GSXL3 monooxygenase [Amia calva]